MASKMKTWAFQISGAGDNYRLVVEARTEEEAREQAEGIVGKGRSLALVRREVGDLDSYLGDEYDHRLDRKIQGMKNMRLWKGGK